MPIDGAISAGIDMNDGAFLEMLKESADDMVLHVGSRIRPLAQ